MQLEGVRGSAQVGVTGDQDGLGTGDTFGGRKMNRVVTAEPLFLRQHAGAAHELVVDVEAVKLFIQHVELSDCRLPGGIIEPAEPMR